jgi:hypothetical protein
VSGREAIEQAIREGLRAYGDSVVSPEMLAYAIAAGIDVHERSQALKAVRLLRVQPGDIVVFHFDELISEQEMEHFRLSVGEHLRERHPDVQFLAADRVSDITVVRPEYGIQVPSVQEMRDDAEARKRVEQLPDVEATLQGKFTGRGEIDG